MKIYKLLILSALFCFSAMAKKGVKVAVSLSPAGSFEITSSKIKGKALKKDGGYIAKKVSVKVKHLKTGLELRDTHLHEKLEKKKFSKIKILEGVGKAGKGSATIMIKDIKKKIKFTYEESGDLLKVSFPLSLKDFKFSGISYLGVGVKDKVTVTAEIPIK